MDPEQKLIPTQGRRWIVRLETNSGEPLSEKDLPSLTIPPPIAIKSGRIFRLLQIDTRNREIAYRECRALWL